MPCGGGAVIVRCTARLLSALRVRPVVDVPPGPDDWYANLLWLDGRKAVLVAHAGTLFSTLVADVHVAQLRPFGRWVRQVVIDALVGDGLDAGVLGRLDADQAVIAKAASRRVLGYLSEMAAQAEWAVADAGGLQNCDLVELNRWLHRELHNMGDRYATPLELVAERRRS